jgi:hypothetical protein
LFSGRLARSEILKKITIKLSIQELEMLTGLAADQLFRKEFIDPKLPGHQFKFAEISAGKALVSRLRSTLAPATGKGPARARKAG